LTEKQWTTPVRSPATTFCVLFSPRGRTCTGCGGRC
jgi:hypothetical protein